MYILYELKWYKLSLYAQPINSVPHINCLCHIEIQENHHLKFDYISDIFKMLLNKGRDVMFLSELNCTLVSYC